MKPENQRDLQNLYRGILCPRWQVSTMGPVTEGLRRSLCVCSTPGTPQCLLPGLPCFFVPAGISPFFSLMPLGLSALPLLVRISVLDRVSIRDIFKDTLGQCLVVGSGIDQGKTWEKQSWGHLVRLL
ncbi:hypothetical protein GDO78_017056 [Eleutherodactylus coqui]|uniref:Uncharacterized protein n=1 Tax=Eleutherodactylus coqui TaxID=57060 RepID=A0A8J6BJT9_ELECQ|nr:hypothetical protein GDO78_017056 [Eleutherodactylus coqui]